MKITKNKGFTLIELLVVISIVGLLSSVVLASLNTARDKGRISAGLQFAGYNYRNFAGSNLIGHWKFDGNLNDSSGNGYVLTAFTTPTPNSSLSNTTANSKGQSLYSPNQYSGSYRTNMLKSWPTTNNNYTISFWIMSPTTINVNNVVFNITSTIPSPTGPNFDFISNRLAHFYLGSGLGSTNNTRFGNPNHLASVDFDFEVNKWYQVTYTFDGNQTYKLYIDGKQIGGSLSDASYSGDNIKNMNNIVVGGFDNVAHSGVGYTATNYIDEFMIFANDLSVAQIEQLYADGLAEHSLATNE